MYYSVADTLLAIAQGVALFATLFGLLALGLSFAGEATR